MAENPRIVAIERATGRTWPDWLAFLESVDAARLDHTRIAEAVLPQLDGVIDSAGWWTQAVAAAYEQHIGRRLPGQRADGTFQTTVSRATGLGMRELMERWGAFAAGDPEVLGMLSGEPRLSGTERRLSWRARAADGSSILITSEPKKDGSSASLIATLAGLPSPEANQGAKATWASILERFLAS